jgi:alkylation response protein AidB-like acyl-CoA dehydrogenase
MDFSFTPDQETLRHHVRELLNDVCPPDYAKACDDEARPPREAYQALAKHGWFGLILPPEYGGTGGSAIDLTILLEETGKHFEELAMWLPGNPIKMSGMTGAISKPAPRLGEHTDAVLGGLLRLSPDEITSLRKNGAVG